MSRPSVAGALGYLTSTRLVISTGYRFVYPFLPAIARGLGVSLQQAGLLVSARSLAATATPLVTATVGRGERRRRLIVAGLGLFTVGSAVTAATGVYAGALVGFVMVGLSKPTFDVAAQAYLADRTPYRRRARTLAVLELAWATSLLIGAPAAGWLIERSGWRAPFWVLAALGAAGGVGAWFAMEEDRPGPQAEARRLRLDRSGRALLGVVALMGFAGDGMLTVLGAWLEDEFGLSLVALGGAATLVALAELAGEGGTFAFADRIGKRRAVGAGLAGSGLGFIGLALASGNLGAGLAVLAVSMAAFELGYVSAVPLASEAVPHARARYLSLFVVAFFVGRTAGAAVSPALFAAGGLPAAAVGAAAAQWAALILLLLAVRVD
jgi:predicted MFS family arabinose efflux permease